MVNLVTSSRFFLSVKHFHPIPGDVIKEIFQSGGVPPKLLKEIESHDLIENLHNVLADTRAAKLDEEGLQQVNSYNDSLFLNLLG